MIFPTKLKFFNIFKIKAFRHLFQQYLFIIATIIMILFFLCHSYALSLQQDLNNKLADNFGTLKTELINEQNIVDTLTNELFIQQPYLSDLQSFLNLDYNDYFEYKTDLYMASDSSVYYGTLTYIKKIFHSYPDIAKIIFYDSSQQHLTIFSSRQGDFSARRQSILPDGILSTKQLNQLVFDNEPTSSDYLAFHKRLNNPSTLDTVADMYYIFDNKNIYTDLKKNNQDSAGEIILSDTDTLFTTKATTDPKGLILAQSARINHLYQLTSFSSLKKMQSQVQYVYLYFLLAAGFIIIVSVPFIMRQLRTYDKKISSITEKMNLIQKGHFSQDSPELILKNPDEFEIILAGLDEMSHELKKYIDEVYVSEIKQKNYQMKTLRAQINPHFLYNTLEAIRMKAIINHDEAVAEMLYNTSRLFKNMIKGKELITLQEELDFCDKYLRLFELRFEDNLFYDITFPTELADVPLEKFSIQPFIENYIVHGIKPDHDANFIEIICQKVDNDLLITVSDNGKGLSSEKLKMIQVQLADNQIEASDSMGLLNVNYRVKELFGSDYGVEIAQNNWQGVTISLRIPYQREEDFNEGLNC